MATKRKTKKDKKIEDVKIFFNEDENKKSNKLKFIIIPLVVIGILLGLLLLLNNIENTVTMLSKLVGSTLNNVSSGTITTNIIIEGNESKEVKSIIEFDIDEDIKVSYSYDDLYKFYINYDSKNVDLYLTNNILDLIGITESNKDKWLTYSITNKKLVKDINENTNNIISDYKTKYNDIDFARFLDETHFYLVDKEDNISHYQLLIDKEMFKNIIHEINNDLDSDSKLSNKKISDILEKYDEYINKDIIVDLYIDTKEYLINRIYIEFNNEYLKENDIDNIIIDTKIEYNNTIVKIENEALESDYTIEKYIDKYKKED